MEPVITSILAKDIDAPSPVYKYRSWDNHLHRTIISTQTVFMAAPSTFEDELEFRNFKRYDLMNDEDIYSKYLQFSYDKNIGFTEEQHHADATEWTIRSPFKNPEYLHQTQQRQFKDYDARVGILSLTDQNNSLAMWNYYAARGKGFCVGLNTQVLFKYVGGGGKVLYPDDGLPLINGTDSFEVERWKQTYNKEVKWKFEQEYRVIIFSLQPLSFNQRRVVLPHECFVELVFGWNMTVRERNNLIKVCKAKRLTPRFFQAIKTGEEILIVPFI